MIALDRLLDDIDRQFLAPRLVEKSLQLLLDQRSIRQGDLEKHAFQSSVWKKAKPQLLLESHNKCAYCESPTAVVAFGDVEHFRPKSVYWWWAYCLDNFLASCAICNQKFKSDKFPLLGRRLRGPLVRRNSRDTTLSRLSVEIAPDPLDDTALERFLDDHDSEMTLLVNPYIDEPADYFAWRADMNIREVELIAFDNDDISADCVAAAEDVYGLNRQQLRTLRYMTFEKLLTVSLTLEDSGISASTRQTNAATLNRMLAPDHPYAGMVRFFNDLGPVEEWVRQGFFVVPDP